MKTILLLIGLVACATSAGSAPETQWLGAYAVADCAPWDGAATSIYLTDAPDGASVTYPNLRLTIYHDLGTVSGTRWTVGQSQPDGAQSVLCRKAGDCILAVAGWIDFALRTGNEPLRGHYDVTLVDGRRLTGRFTAPIRATTMLCG